MDGHWCISVSSLLPYISAYPHPLPVPRFPHTCFLYFHCHLSVVHNTNHTQINILNQADAIAIPTLNKPRCRFHLTCSFTHLFCDAHTPYKPPREVFTPPRGGHCQPYNLEINQTKVCWWSQHQSESEERWGHSKQIEGQKEDIESAHTFHEE